VIPKDHTADGKQAESAARKAAALPGFSFWAKGAELRRLRGAGRAERAGRRPGGGAADTGGARVGEAETACGPDPYLAEDGRGGPGKAETDPRKGRTPK